MLSSVSRSRVSPHNVCISCLASPFRPAVVAERSRQFSLAKRQVTTVEPKITSEPSNSGSSDSISKTESNVSTATHRSQPRKEKKPQTLTDPQKISRRAGKKSRTDGVIDTSASINKLQDNKVKDKSKSIKSKPVKPELAKSKAAKSKSIKSKSIKSKSVKTTSVAFNSVKSGTLASKITRKIYPGDSPGSTKRRNVRSEVRMKSVKSKLSALKTKGRKVGNDSSDSEVFQYVLSTSGKKRITPITESAQVSLEKNSPLIRRAHIEARTAAVQRLIAKTHILRLNKQGGLTDMDKLQVMEHLRRSMEDKVLAEVVSFTKRRGSAAATSSDDVSASEYAASPRTVRRRRRNAAVQKRGAKGSDSAGLKTSPTAPSPEPSIPALKQSSKLTAYEIQTIEANKLKLVALEKPQPPVPKLSYGLERVLFNPGVYHLQDPRSRVFNFDPYLQSIMPIRDFDFSALKEYITSSRDQTLISTAADENKKYSGSTSSMTSVLAHFHFLLSQWRPINTSSLSRGFPSDYQTFTAIQRAPSAIFLRWRDGTYAIDADKQYDTANILMMLGKSMEKLLTLPTEEFEKYRKQNSSQISEEERNESESYHYTTMGDFLMRSQLDAYDPRLPGTGMFDLKTRAVVSIRMDAKNYEKGLGYEIRNRHGEYESYEREYYDMIRSAFLKYSLQVRMGRMDGIFVAFHNTERIFGFQYISLPEMDFALHGTEDLTTGDAEFKTSLELLNRALDRATAKYPEQSLRLHFETRAGVAPFMYIFAEPLSENEIDKIQASNKAEIAEFEMRALGLHNNENEDEATEWGNLQANVEREMENDELGADNLTESAENLVDIKNISKNHAEIERRVKRMLYGMTADEEDADEEMESEDGLFKAPNIEESSKLVNDMLSRIDTIDYAVEHRVDEHADVDEIEDNVEGAGDKELEDEINVEKPEEDTIIVDGQLDEVQDIQGVEVNLLRDNEYETSTEDLKASLERDQANDDSNSDLLIPEETLETDSEFDYDMDVLRGYGGHDLADIHIDGSRDILEDEELNHCPLEMSEPSSTRNRLSANEDPDKLLAMTLTIRNKVNGRYVTQPTNLTSDDDWSVEYALAEVPQLIKAQTLYRASQKRRETCLASKSKENDTFVSRYMETLYTLSKKGRQWREEQDQIDQAERSKVLLEKEISDEVSDHK